MLDAELLGSVTNRITLLRICSQRVTKLNGKLNVCKSELLLHESWVGERVELTFLE